jgi:CheY-like chemotaxis protein
MSHKRVLVVDDRVETRRRLREGLSQQDWQVDEAPNAFSALEAIQQARAYGEGFSVIITELILPDQDGILFIKTLRQQFPGLPLIVLTDFGSERGQVEVEQIENAAYIERPVEIAQLLSTLQKFELECQTVSPAPAPPWPKPDDAVGAYIFFRINSPELASSVYDQLRLMAGVMSANAVRGSDFDLILRVAVPSEDTLARLLEEMQRVQGATLVEHERYLRPMLSATTEEFVRHYRTVSAEENKDYLPGQDTNAYLMIDVDRYQMERIYTSILLTRGVFRCRVTSGGNKLMVLMSQAVQPGVVRHLLRKLAEMDGILRVREATVINVAE